MRDERSLCSERNDKLRITFDAWHARHFKGPGFTRKVQWLRGWLWPSIKSCALTDSGIKTLGHRTTYAYGNTA